MRVIFAYPAEFFAGNIYYLLVFYQQWIAQVIEMFLITDKESLILNDMAADGLTTQRTNAWSALG